ncbi:MAG: hypothetical protein U5K69_12625 [Balneolaceae bacterium]|nr:hypothetical protein [Balneolaceae bacterium]
MPHRTGCIPSMSGNKQAIFEGSPHLPCGSPIDLTVGFADTDILNTQMLLKSTGQFLNSETGTPYYSAGKLVSPASRYPLSLSFSSAAGTSGWGRAELGPMHHAPDINPFQHFDFWTA